MNQNDLLLDAMDNVNRNVAECNKAAKSLLAEAVPFTKPNEEEVLAGDIDRIMSLAMDLVGGRGRLALAKKDLDALKRRQA